MVHRHRPVCNPTSSGPLGPGLFAEQVKVRPAQGHRIPLRSDPAPGGSEDLSSTDCRYLASGARNVGVEGRGTDRGSSRGFEERPFLPTSHSCVRSLLVVKGRR